VNIPSHRSTRSSADVTSRYVDGTSQSDPVLTFASRRTYFTQP